MRNWYLCAIFSFQVRFYNFRLFGFWMHWDALHCWNRAFEFGYITYITLRSSKYVSLFTLSPLMSKSGGWIMKAALDSLFSTTELSQGSMDWLLLAMITTTVLNIVEIRWSRNVFYYSVGLWLKCVYLTITVSKGQNTQKLLSLQHKLHAECHVKRNNIQIKAFVESFLQ